MKKKLLIATDSYLPRWDGISRFLSELIPRLTDDYDITVVAPDFPGNKKSADNEKVVRIPLSRFKAGDYTFAKVRRKKIKKLVKEHDMVWTQTIGPIGILAIHYAKKQGIPLASYVHSIDWELASRSISRPYLSLLITNLMKRIAKRAYNKSNLILVPSKEVARIFDSEKIIAPKKVIYLGTDTYKFVPAENKSEAKKKIGINPENIVIGYHGRIGREKDLIRLYNVFIKLQKDFENITMLVIGSGLQEQEALFKSALNIKHIRSTNNVVPFLQAMDIYVLPSLTETTSLSTLEAMSCGCAVLCTRVGLVKRYIKDKYNGSFFPKGNEAVLRLKLKWLIENPNVRARLGRNARKTISKKFNWEKTEIEIIKALESL